MFTAIEIVSFPQVLSYVRRFIAIPNKNGGDGKWNFVAVLTSLEI